MFVSVVFRFMVRIFEDFLAASDAAIGLLESPEVAAGWAGPSACAGFSVGGLAAHLGWQVQAARLAVQSERPATGAAVTDLVGHYGGAAWIDSGPDSPANVGIRDTGEQRAAAGPVEIAAQTRAARGFLAGWFASSPDVREVVALPWIEGRAMTLQDLLSTRVLELVIHADDLAVSVGVATPQASDSAYELVTGLLTRLAVRRHGPVAVLRALSRAERAPESIAAL
jgi:hypothetical protein